MVQLYGVVVGHRVVIMSECWPHHFHVRDIIYYHCFIEMLKMYLL